MSVFVSVLSCHNQDTDVLTEAKRIAHANAAGMPIDAPVCISKLGMVAAVCVTADLQSPNKFLCAAITFPGRKYGFIRDKVLVLMSSYLISI